MSSLASPEYALGEGQWMNSSEERVQENQAKEIDRELNFWHWLFFDGDSKAGWKRLVDWWLFFHIMVGVGLTILSTNDLAKVASVGVLPLAAMFFALAFAWVGNALSMLTNSSFKLVARHRKGGVKEYAYTYQLAVLTAMVTISGWALVAAGVVEPLSEAWRLVASFLLFSLASLTIRECWQVIYGAHRSLIVSDIIDQKMEEEGSEQE